MTETKLPILPCCCGVITASGRHECDNCKSLLAHEKHAQNKIELYLAKAIKKKCTKEETKDYFWWGGYVFAVQSLRGGTK